ncbi:MAG: [FeFe] hydrogenase H-cluster maturation GTPase HydF [Oscillospiraceae bacterium]|nr:[FeFe] hydrogenase H-cluster maturation GTPase HydF [Oscillospiraceae bacterium]
MGLNDTPSANRVHIGFFGRRNAGKSSLVNAVTGQELAVVSDVAGTTTDPVYKAMELLPLGPVMIIDTAGFDDEGELGELRIKKTKQVLNKTDVAVLVVSCEEGLKQCDEELLELFRKKEIPYIIAFNKADIAEGQRGVGEDRIFVSAVTGEGVFELKERIGRLANTEDYKLKIVGDLLKAGDVAVLVVPVDSAAPKGRLILPQQQTIRDILEADAVSVVVKENGLREALAGLGKKPAMVITDSQVFEQVAKDTPEDVPLTSFSILMARYKGFLDTAVIGAKAIDGLKDGDTVLISEGCTHHRQCDDIGTVKLPKWLKKYTGKELVIKTSSGTGFPDELAEYSLVIHCGGCMLNEREVKYRMKCAVDAGVPFTNYGTAIAFMNGILKRSVEMFPHLAKEIQ